jgi:hypothetical protein
MSHERVPVDEFGPTYLEALERTEEISRNIAQMTHIAEHVIAPQIRKSIELADWQTLGHKSVSEWLSERFAGHLTQLNRVAKVAFATDLGDAGVSTRAIAQGLGVSQPTVSRMQHEGDSGESPQGKTHGLDGKLYPRSKSKSKFKDHKRDEPPWTFSDWMLRAEDVMRPHVRKLIQVTNDIQDYWDYWEPDETPFNSWEEAVIEVLHIDPHAAIEAGVAKWYTEEDQRDPIQQARTINVRLDQLVNEMGQSQPTKYGKDLRNLLDEEFGKIHTKADQLQKLVYPRREPEQMFDGDQ